MIARKLVTFAAAAAFSLTSVAASAATSASVLSLDDRVRAGANMERANSLEGEGLPTLLGLIILVLLIAIATGGSGGPDNAPISP